MVTTIRRRCARPLLAVLAALLPSTPAPAADVAAEVAFHGELIHFSLDARVGAPADAVIAMLHDYENLGNVFPLVQSAKRRGSPGTRVERVETLMRGCVLFVCHDLRHTLDIVDEGSGRFRGITVPDQSQALFGHFIWRIDALQHNPPLSRIRLDGRFQPELSIPPLIGRPLVRRMLERELKDGVRRIKQHLGTEP